ncbi:MAG TPA: hypothetical protein PKY56_11340 [Candidatus Kapabacteria bacterium]|nr:hypothetical protein [Candidatus Kapabacteria bacterium]HPO62986.1 hypothetical protein [Candidatus Kapabacteria bacterium]
MAGRKRTRRAKYITLFSPFLMRETKHELIGEPIETDKGRQQWARCTRSRHSQLINLDTIEAESDKSKAVIHISKEDAKKYSPLDEYQIGDVIFHAIWDDVGIVKSKESTSTGGRAIIVHFERCNEKKLIENFQKS